MDIILNDDETLDDLQNGYKIIQKTNNFRYGVDAVLLADFAKLKNSDRVIEFGTGTGVISLLLYAKYKPAEIKALEIQPDMVEMANRSIKMNHLESHINILEMNLIEAPNSLGRSICDCVVTNPPYIKKQSGVNNPEISKAIARFEIMCTLSDVVKSAKELIRPGGKLFMVHRADRLVDIIYSMREVCLEPKRIRFVHSNVGKRPHIILIEGTRGGNPELKFMDPLYIYDRDGNYTEEIIRIYGGKNHEW